ncbi:MAG: 4Fe-4S binding protein [Methanomicrobiales archaeon]|nr:4Fe-4S binding protein [Methanomicrobiales archaeon]
MKRKIIHIDEEKCTGCGLCIPDCPEGALQVIDGKARLVSDLFCDGLGACIGTCPEGAIAVTEREAGAYDEKAVMANISGQGVPVIRAHLEHLLAHDQADLYNEAVEYLEEHHMPVPGLHATGCPTEPVHLGRHPFAGCPGSAARRIAREGHARDEAPAGSSSSELRQWPVQLALLNPAAPYFDDADLLVSADCVPFAFAGFHEDLLRGKILVVFCPKLDRDIDRYIAKLAAIFSNHRIPSITVAHMEVPCCGGVRDVVDQALERSGKKIPVKEITISIDGQII